MRDYKVGDTVYVKGTVGRTDDTRNPCYVEFGYGIEGWIPRDNIIDELPVAEPVKPVLPKGVVDELIEAKAFGYNFLGYMNVALDNEYPSTNMFSFDGDDVHENKKIKTLSDAWYNGYTIEKEKKYNLILGTETDGDTNALVKNNPRTDAVLWLNTNAYANDLKLDKLYQFTQEEIDKYNKNFWIKNIDLNDYKELVADD